MNNLAHGILLIYVTHILCNSVIVVVVVVVIIVFVVVAVVAVIVAIVIDVIDVITIIIIIGTKITNQGYNAYSCLGVVSHWLFRLSQQLATCTGEWEKLLDACEIKTIFD